MNNNHQEMAADCYSLFPFHIYIHTCVRKINIPMKANTYTCCMYVTSILDAHVAANKNT